MASILFQADTATSKTRVLSQVATLPVNRALNKIILWPLHLNKHDRALRATLIRALATTQVYRDFQTRFLTHDVEGVARRFALSNGIRNYVPEPLKVDPDNEAYAIVRAMFVETSTTDAEFEAEQFMRNFYYTYPHLEIFLSTMPADPTCDVFATYIAHAVAFAQFLFIRFYPFSLRAFKRPLDLLAIFHESEEYKALLR